MYIDEYLIQKAEDLDPEVYIRRLLGGFVMSYREPEFGSCGLGNDPFDVDSLENITSQSFTLCREINGTEFYTLGANLSAAFPWMNNEDNCPALNASEGSVGSGAEGLDGNSVVDGFSANVAQMLLCSEDNDDSPQAIFTTNPSPQSQQNIEATVYYNNNVSYVRIKSEHACPYVIHVHVHVHVSGLYCIHADSYVVICNFPTPRHSAMPTV